MKFLKEKIFSVLFVCGLLAFTASGAPADEKWTEIRSENFHLVGNAAPSEINQVAVKLEQFRFVFTKLFKQFNFTAPIPTTVLVFKDDQSFHNFKPLNESGQPKEFVKGYFLPGTDLNYIALSAEANKLNDFTTIYHEYVHFLLNNTLGQNNIPPWLNEGFAEYYEQLKIENEMQVVLGEPNLRHLNVLKSLGLIPLEKFLSVDYYTLSRQPKESTIQFYAQAWAIVHLLIHDPENPPSSELNDFAKLLTKDVSIAQAFQTVYKITPEMLEKKLQKYIQNKSFAATRLRLDVTSSARTPTHAVELTEADSLAYQGDLLLHANRPYEAEKILSQALLKNPTAVLANTSMGFLQIKKKDFTEARKYLEKAVHSELNNFYAHYGYAYLLSREGMSDHGFIILYRSITAENIRKNLLKAIRLNPNYAESYHLYAFVNYVQNENLDEGLEMIEKALQIAPGNQWYQIRKAELLMKKQNFQDARAITQKVVQTAPDDQLKLYSINTLNLINNWEAQMEAAKNAEKALQNPAVTEKPLSEEEILRLNQIALREALNQALRKPQATEKRMAGLLVTVECEANQIVFTFMEKGKTYKLRSNSFNDVILTSFIPNDAGTQIGCNIQTVKKFAVLTYRPSRSSASSFLGEAVAFEFVPENFTFIEMKDAN